jgi:peptidyl-prolyl cis-trans isomerase C
MTTIDSLARVNGVALAAPRESLNAEELRQRACVELLRQEAISAGLLDAVDPGLLGGAMTEHAGTAIEALLARNLQQPEPSDEACRRYYAAHSARFAAGERVQARHILFAVTPGVDVVALRERAEACLLDLRSQPPGAQDRFPQVAATTSNCPSGAQGGELGRLTCADCAPEFARELFGQTEVGVLPRLVNSRFGLHVVEVLAREPGAVPAFETVRSAVTQTLRQQTFAIALRQYLQLLAGKAKLEGVDLDAAVTPLLQ